MTSGPAPVQDPAKAVTDKAAADKAAADKAAADKIATTPAPNPDSNAGKLDAYPILQGWTALGSTLQIVLAVLSLIPTIIIAYGAAKISWSVNQSVFWAIIDFIFAGFYYPYYAYFQLPQPGLMGAIGARRRR